MARRVAAALDNHEHAVIEAGTGTGKSLAYLLPIVRSGVVALISTANKNLQEQLFYKDIPFVQQHVQPFKAALVKGMGNYLCLDRLQEEHGFQQLVKTPAFARMEQLMEEHNAWDGDLDLLPMSLPPDVRGRVAAESDQCAWRSCPFFGDCYVRKMRERSHNLDDKEEQLYEKLIKRTRSLAADLRIVFAVKEPDERVYYVEQSGGYGRRAAQPSVSAAPLSVTELLRDKLFDRISTIATSATLAIGGDFRFFRARVGLTAAQEAVLPPTFH